MENSSLSSIPKLANAVIAGPEPARSDSSMRILVVEDDPNVRDMLSLLLGTRWNVSIAADAAAALDLVRRTTPDLVISDVRMPRVDGITLLRRLRDEPATRDVPVILVSGQAGEQETIAGLEAGADDFLVKPFSARELLVRVQTRLEVTAMRRRNAQQEAALESMRRHTAWTERLLDSLPVPLLLLQPGEARILFGNRATVALFGTRLLRGMPLSEFASLRLPDEEGAAEIPPDQLAPLSSVTRLQGRRLVWDTPCGKIWLLADSELVPGLHEHPDDVAVLTLRDITRLVTHEQELRRTVHLREEFLSTASHELRTPITTLGLQTEVLLRNHAGLLDDTLRRKLTVIRNQVLRLDQLVNVLLDVSRLMAGRLILSVDDCDLLTIVGDAVEMVRDSAERAGCPLRVSGPTAVPGRWDRLRVGQVVTNLLSNAIKFGHGHPVDVAVSETADTVRLVVSDSGVGIPADALARIFERFERASSDRHFPGMGLGLWITKQIVEACHGMISVQSQLGAGSTFCVELPRLT